jgi:hypothetical protein
VTHLRREQKRRVKIRVLPDEGYYIDVQLEKDMSLEKVLSTLEELGFKYLSEKKPLHGEKQELDTGELIKDIYNKFMLISQDYRESIRRSEKFYENWIKMGFDIVDLRDAIEVYIPFLGEDKGDSGVITEAADEKLEKASLARVPEHDTAISSEGGPASETHTRPMPNDLEYTAIETVEIKEEVPEIRPLFDLETSDNCKYCSIFRDMGNIVCPNCGRALNLRVRK